MKKEASNFQSSALGKPIITHKSETTIRFIADHCSPVPVPKILITLDRQEAGYQKAGNEKVRRLPQGGTDIVEANDFDPAPPVLDGCHQTDKISVSGYQNDPVKIAGLKEGVDGKIHVGIRFGGDDPFFVYVVLNVFFNDLETAVPNNIVVIMNFLPIFGIVFCSFPILSQVRIGSEKLGVSSVGEVDQNVITHAVAPAQPYVFCINVYACLEHLNCSITLFGLEIEIENPDRPFLMEIAVWFRHPYRHSRY